MRRKDVKTIEFAEVQKETGTELVHNGVVRQNLGRHLLFCSQITPHNALKGEFGTSLL